jgi:hypothetical protein
MTETPPSTRTKVKSWIDELVPTTKRPDSGAMPLDLDEIERALETPPPPRRVDRRHAA